MNRILIVEDEENLASFIEKGLKKRGFHTTLAADGNQALEAAKAQIYDAILLDLGLPVKDGWMVLKELRDRGDFSPVIVMSAMGDLRQEVLAKQANDYLQKPFRFTELLAAIARQITEAPR
ncbi:MAG: response regulator transcription factor [Cyanobacteria bacterium P01_F01_bin.53]